MSAAEHDHAELGAPTPVPEPQGHRLRWWMGLLTLALLVLPMTLPAAYILEGPGPSVDTVGTVKGKDVISIDGRKSYATDTQLALTTVSLAGGPGQEPLGLEVLMAWMNPVVDIQPQEAYYPLGVTVEQQNEQSDVEMTSSQTGAELAALNYLGIKYQNRTKVAGFSDASNQAVLNKDDVVATVNGTKVGSPESLQAAVQKIKEPTASLGITRKGKAKTVIAKLKKSQETGKPSLGIYIAPAPKLPFNVNYAIGDIGGASAGTMMTLGLIDKLTPGSLGGKTKVAGTGTITPEGKVGSIGGIPQKVAGAHQDGAEVFLAPAANCDELKERVPDGIRVYSMKTVDDAVKILKALKSGKKPTAPVCGVSG